MKRQYLGDSKDSFKWDYLDFLVRTLGYANLQIAWMMTPDDSSPDGRTAPELFHARPEILKFCNSLRSLRDPDRLSELPTSTGAGYGVTLHGSDKYFDNNHRNSYFSGIDGSTDKVLFLDPDNGFEPERSYSEKHVLYSEVDRLIKTISPHSVITVFQHIDARNSPLTSLAFANACTVDILLPFIGIPLCSSACLDPPPQLKESARSIPSTLNIIRWKPSSKWPRRRALDGACRDA